jgi:hypothetical protein
MADVLPFAGTVLVEPRAVMTVRHLPAGARAHVVKLDQEVVATPRSA